MFRSQTQASDEPSDSCSIDAVAFGNFQEHRHRIALNRVDAQSTAITRLSRWRESKFRMGLKIRGIRRCFLHEPIDRSLRIRRI